MGEFQELKEIEGLEISSVSADLYGNGRDDLSLFYFKEGANYATIQTTSSIISESIVWNQDSNRKKIKALMVNTKNANTFTGKQGLESLDEISKNLSKSLTIKESKSEEGITERQKEILDIYLKFHDANLHKMTPIPIFKKNSNNDDHTNDGN